MANFKADIEAALDDDVFEAIVVGEFGGWSRGDKRDIVPPDKRGVPVSWAEAAPWLDYEYEDGFGGADCHAIYAWSKNFVYFIGEYDGSTGVQCVPRNPVESNPSMQ